MNTHSQVAMGALQGQWEYGSLRLQLNFGNQNPAMAIDTVASQTGQVTPHPAYLLDAHGEQGDGSHTPGDLPGRFMAR